MRTIEPLADEADILREANSDVPQRQVPIKEPPVTSPVRTSILVPAPPPPSLSAPSPTPSSRWRYRWLFTLATTTILANIFLALSLLMMPSDTSMLLAGRPLFALPIPGDPEALAHPADYLTMGLAVVQVILAFFIVKFRVARIAIAYVAIATLCLSIRAWMLALSQPEGELLWLSTNPLFWVIGALTGYLNTYMITSLFAGYFIPFALLVTALVTVFRDWRNARNFSQSARTQQSELSV